MKTIVATAFVCLMAANAAAQTIQITAPWARTTGTTLALTSQTEDGKTVEYVVVLNGKQGRIRVPSADVQPLSIKDYWPFGTYTGHPYAIIARVCGYVVPGKVEYAVPKWAADYGVTLEPDMPESEFRRQIEEAKRQIDQDERLGRKGLKRELDAWAREVRQNGAAYDTTFCKDAVVAAGTVESWSFSQSPQVNVLSVAGRDGRYYLMRGTR